MDSPCRALLRLLILTGPVVDKEEDDEAERDVGRLIVAVADSDPTCCPVIVAE